MRWNTVRNHGFIGAFECLAIDIPLFDQDLAAQRAASNATLGARIVPFFEQSEGLRPLVGSLWRLKPLGSEDTTCPDVDTAYIMR